MKQKLLLLLAVLLPSISASAHDFEVDGIYYNILSEREMTCEVTYNDSSIAYSGVVVIPSTVTFCGRTFSVTVIGDGAFVGCVNLTSVVIPDSVTSIDPYAFSGCVSLTSVKIPNSVTEIGYHTFSSCWSLTTVEIPNSVTSIGDTAFYKCYYLKEITSLNPTPPIIWTDTFDYVDKSTCVLKVPTEAVEAYKAADGWKDFYNIEGITATGINSATIDGVQDGKTFNLQGQPVNDTFKGVVIRNGKKMLRK